MQLAGSGLKCRYKLYSVRVRMIGRWENSYFRYELPDRRENRHSFL